MKTVIELTREAGGFDATPKFLERFAELVTEQANARANTSWTLMCEKMVAIEREACAKAAEEHMRECEGASFGIGAAIRARSTHET